MTKNKKHHLIEEVRDSMESPKRAKRRLTNQGRPSIGTVAMYTLAGKFKREYPSMAAASRATRTTLGNISKAINGKRKSAGGYIWKRSEDNHAQQET